MPKKFEVSYTLTFHVEAKDEKEVEEIGEKALMDFLRGNIELLFGVSIEHSPNYERRITMKGE